MPEESRDHSLELSDQKERTAEIVPEGLVLPPAHWNPANTPLHRRPIFRVVGSAILLLTAVPWLMSNFFQLRGYVNLLASRIDLLVAVLLVLGFVCVFASSLPKHRFMSGFVVCLVVVVAAIGLDRITMRTQVQPVENKANGDTRSDTSYPPTAGTSPPPPAKSTTKHLGSLRTKVSLPNPDPLVPKTAPAPDPRIDLVRQAREMADKVERMHQQLDSELQQLWKERDDDVDISTTNRGPLTHEQAVDLNEQIKHSWDGPEQEIRDGAAARFQKCCLQDAIRIREQLMIEAPGVSTYQDGNTYQNNPGHNPGYSMGDYHTISQDLNKLANAVEVKIKFAGTESR